MNISIRKIKESDNAELAKIIRNSLVDFNAAKAGTVFYDETTDYLSDVFKAEHSVYFVAEIDGFIAGGAGIYPTDGLKEGTCELVKLYLHSSFRGKGIGKMLLHTCFEAATSMGYKSIYLETMPELIVAVPMYQKAGFTFLTEPMGNSGHTGCDIWMIKHL